MDKKDPLCSDCYKNIRPIVSTDIELSKTKKIKVWAVSDYQEPLKSLILAKHGSNPVAAHQLGAIMASNLPESFYYVDYIVPIPLHWSRYAYRGFNQAEIIAQNIANKLGKPVEYALTRKKRTHFQAKLDVQSREENVKYAFTVCKKIKDFENKHILLVDDLMTTGSTVSAASKVLLTLKPASIQVAIACRVV